MTGVELNPSSQYHFWLSAVRANADNPGRVAEIIDGDGSEFVVGPLAAQEPYVEVVLYGEGTSSYKRLAGQQYYPVFDCAAWHEPYLWVTTDRVTRLSLLRIDETQPEVVELKSVEINDGFPSETNTILGHDRQINELFLLTADGRRRWFDPLSLEQTAEDQLAGEWRFEQGALGFIDEQYSFHLGLPLTGEVYRRTMQVLMVLFLSGLLGLSIIWSKRWMYTLDQTTGDTKPESS